MNSAVFLAEGVRDFDGLAEKYHRRIWSVAYRFLHNPEDAEDVTQEVLLRLHKWLPQLHPGARLKAWIYRTATNTALNFSRGEAIRARHHRAAAREASLTSHPQPVRSGLADAIARSIDTLPRQQRAIVTLRLLEDHTFREIAETFGVAEGTVKVQFARALRRLRDQLSNWR